MGEFENFFAVDYGNQFVAYTLKDANDVTFMVKIFALQTCTWINVTEEMPSPDFDLPTDSVDMRKLPSNCAIKLGDNIIAYVFEHDFEIRLLIGNYYFQIMSENLDGNHTGPKLYQYPTDGEETFISRLLDSTTAKEAVDELAEKILAEQGAEE